jgi:signal transduction histidine kinase
MKGASMSGKILIIEDEMRLRTNLKLLLTSEGYTVSTAADGEEGLAYLQQEPCDLVITDIMMGEVNGFQVMEYIAKHTPETLVIVITGFASTESVVESLRKGAYDYIAKPFEIEMILISIERALEKVRLQRELKGYVEALEHRVAARTRDLEVTNAQLHASLAELQEAQEHLIQTEKLSALGELISGFAHEVNNPLTTVLGYAELLVGSEECSAEVSSILEKVRQEAMRCHRIVQNLLSFARKRKPAKDYSDITTICRKTLDLLAYQLMVNNVAVVTSFVDKLPWTMVDGYQFQQVLVNLLNNASQAMAQQQGKRQIMVTTTHDDAKIYVTITDTGSGIAAEHLGRIFDPFYTTKEKGTGLGLSLSYGLIKEHGGEITVTSTPNEGATFTIALPILDDAFPDTAPYSAPHKTSLLAKKILIVDDEQNLAQMLSTILQSLGHQAEAATSGWEALKKIDTQDYDAIICDLKMPEIDGRQIYHYMQTSHPAFVKRLILSSGDTISEENQKFLQETGCLFLPKPFLLDELKRIISQVSACGMV